MNKQIVELDQFVKAALAAKVQELETLKKLLLVEKQIFQLAEGFEKFNQEQDMRAKK